MIKISKTHAVIKHWWNFRLQLLAESILTGALVGLLIVLFRFILEKSDVLRKELYVYINSRGIWYIALWFVALIIIGYIISLLLRIEPLASGSGIPQVKGFLLGRLKMNWLKLIIVKFSGGIMAIGAGLSLGREGPSVQLGAAIGQGVSRMLGRLRIEEKYLVTSGASAGLAAAFNAPLAGVIFALEEMHKNFSSAVLTSAMAASLTADFISQKFLGQKPIFNFHYLPTFPLNYYFYLILLGIIIGVFGVIFNSSLLKTLNLYDSLNRLPKFVKPMIPLIVGGLLGFILPQTLGGGHILIESIRQGQLGFKILIILILVKFLFTMLCYGSGVPGGIFLPLLVIGALTGDLYGGLLTHYLPVNPQYINNFVVLAMAAYFTAIVKAPVTGSILITEMTGSFTHLLALITISITAYVVSDVLKSQPIYESLLERALHKEGITDSLNPGDKKAIMEIAVCLSSQIAGKVVKDIAWPSHCLLVGLKRGEAEIIPKGNTRIMSGDYLIVLTDEDKAAQVKKTMLDLSGEDLV